MFDSMFLVIVISPCICRLYKNKSACHILSACLYKNTQFHGPPLLGYRHKLWQTCFQCDELGLPNYHSQTSVAVKTFLCILRCQIHGLLVPVLTVTSIYAIDSFVGEYDLYCSIKVEHVEHIDTYTNCVQSRYIQLIQ